MSSYYNENDPRAAAWLRELIARGLIASGDVDERSIEEVKPDELTGYFQLHFFAGIGVWSYALRRAGWPDDRPVWTGSCPCQPFSGAGAGKGFDDERHLWPDWLWLIRQRRPVRIFGEQVTNGAGLDWLDHVSTDLENEGYAVGSVDLCAAGVGAPHIRQRSYFTATRLGDPGRPGLPIRELESVERAGRRGEGRAIEQPGRPPRGLADAAGERRGERAGHGDREPSGVWWYQPADGSAHHELDEGRAARRPGPVNGFWRDSDWLSCRDEKFRPVEPGTFPLVDGAPARVGRLRGYGNAINAEVARHFIEAAMSADHNNEEL